MLGTADGKDDGLTGTCSPPPQAQQASYVLLPLYVYGARKEHQFGLSAIEAQVKPL